MSTALAAGREQRGQLRRDMQLGKERGRQDAERTREQANRRMTRGNGEASAGLGSTASRLEDI